MNLGRQLSEESKETIQWASVRLSQALVSSDEWSRLQASLAALNDHDLQELRRTRSSLCEELREEHVRMHAESNLLRRGLFRHTVVAKHLDLLDGHAAEYALAFKAAEELLSLVLSVAGQLAVYPSPVQLSDVSKLSFDAGPPRSLSFVMSHAPLLDVCQLVTLDDSLVNQLLYIQSLTISARQGGSFRQTVTARILE